MSVALRIVWPESDANTSSASLSRTMSLTEFYRSWFAPAMAGRLRRKATIAQEEESLRLWAEYTGDPPVCAITPQIAASFVIALSRRQTKRGLISVNTVRKHLRTLQPIMDRLGPPGPRLRIASGLLDMAPVLPMPRAAYRPLALRMFTRDELRSILVAADHATESPATMPIPTRVWWRSIVFLAYNTALRVGSLLALRWSDFEDECWAVLPPHATKNGQPLLTYWNAEARRTLMTLRQYGADLVLPWAAQVHSIHNVRRALWQSALPEGRRWGFHAIRRATLNWAAATNPLLARLIAGHATGDTLRDHYVDPRSISELLDHLPPLE